MALRSLTFLGSIAGSVGISVLSTSKNQDDAGVADIRGEDGQALDLHRENTQTEMGICACKQWDTVYTGLEKACTAAEYFFITQKAFDYVGEFAFREWYWLNKTVGDQLCEKFYKKIAGNGCLRMDMSMHHPAESWCYTDMGCHQLNGGKLADNGALKWKKCVGGDTWYGHKTPGELAADAASYGVDAPLLFKLSYNFYPDKVWDDVGKFFINQGLGGSQYYLDPTLFKDMSRIAQMKHEYTIFNGKPNGHVPLYIVQGWDVWELDESGTLHCISGDACTAP